jgi:hypothetical protein
MLFFIYFIIILVDSSNFIGKIMKIKEVFFRFRQWKMEYYRVVHGFKTALACILGLVLAKYNDWPTGQWIPITVMVVMSAQIHFGGALYKALMRMLGTLSGVAITILVLSLFGSDYLVVLLTIFFSVIFFSYIAGGQGDVSYAGTLGGVTVILILSGQSVGIAEALHRGFCITMGVIIALIISRTIFPFHARNRLRYRIVTTLRNLSELYLMSIELHLEDTAYYKLGTRIARHIAEQPRLLHEAKVGSFAIAKKKQLFADIIESEQILNKLINLNYIARKEQGAQDLVEKYQIYLSPIQAVISNNLNYLAGYLEHNGLSDVDIFEKIDDSLLQIYLIAETLSSGYGGQQIILQGSFLFVMKQLLRELEITRNLIIKVDGKTLDDVL